MVASFPPLYFERLRRLKRITVKVLGLMWAVAVAVLVVDLTRPMGATLIGALLWAVALWLSWAFWMGFRGAKRARVVPYFRKGTVRVESKTFLTGKFLARCWGEMEEAARELSIEPLSHFGLEDENEVHPFEWHDATRGLASVAALARCSRLPGEVRVELALFEAALREASEKGVPFRLLLLGDHGMSGAEADVRSGYF